MGIENETQTTDSDYGAETAAKFDAWADAIEKHVIALQEQVAELARIVKDNS